MGIRTLIIGLGQIGMEYDLHLDAVKHVYSHARAFSQHPKFDLVGGVDSDEMRRQTFTQVYVCPAYHEIERALEKGQPDLVVIAVPTQFHNQVLQRVLSQAQPKMILCEKPLSENLPEARSMVQACADKNIRLYVNYMRRSDPGVIEIKRRLLSGEINGPIKGVVWYSKGFFHNGSHFLNLMAYWLGPIQNSMVINRGRLWAQTDPEPDLQMTFEHGEIVFLAAWEESFSHYTVELLSPSGRLRYEQEGQLIQWQKVKADPYFKGYTVLATENETIYSGMDRRLWHVAEQLANGLEGREAQLCTGVDALETLEKMKKILEEK